MRRALLVVWIPTFLLIGVLAGLMGVVDVYKNRAAKLLAAPVRGLPDRPTGALRRARAAIETARWLHPGDPEVQAWHVEWLRREAAQTPVWAPETRERLRKAVRATRALTRQRPTWPYYWASLAQFKFRLGALDEEFDHAVERATTLGPWEPDVNLALADLGLVAWPLLKGATRRRMRANLVRSLERHGRDVIGFAVRYGREDVLASLIGNKEVLKRQLAIARAATRSQ